MNTEPTNNGEHEAARPELAGVEQQRLARPPESPTSLAEWLWYVRRYEHGIYVRVQRADGRWGNASLAELSPEEWGKHVARWLDEGGLPCRVLEEGERPSEKLTDSPRETVD